MSKKVPGTTKGKDIFNIVDEFFKKNDLEWSKLVGCATDGAPAMLGRKSRSQSYVKAVSPEIIFTHCFISVFTLRAKVLPPELLSCLQQIVNFVKTSVLNTRLFAKLCADLGSDHKCLLFYTEVRWLSRENMTRRVFELRNELLEFFEQRNHNFKQNLGNAEFLSRLAYLSDIFDTLNHMNMFFQGPNSTTADFVSKLEAYVRKLDLWTTNIEGKQYHVFKDLSSLQYQHSKKLFQEICCHLKLLKSELTFNYSRWYILHTIFTNSIPFFYFEILQAASAIYPLINSTGML